MNNKQIRRILIIGVGGIGSQLLDLLIPAFTAGDMAERLGGIQIHIMDDDRVEFLKTCARLSGDEAMNAWGLRVCGQGFMIDNYKNLNHDEILIS